VNIGHVVFMSVKKTTIITLCIIFLIGVFFIVGFGYFLHTPNKKGGPDQIFYIRVGSSLKEVVDELEKKEIIYSGSLFLLWARLMGYSRDIKAGEYHLSSGMTPLKILKIINEGTIITYPVTIPEGFTKRQIGELLEKKGIVDNIEFLSLTEDPNIAKLYDISGPGLEGYLYPDTYYFGKGLSPMSVIDVMVKRFWNVVEPFQERAEKLGMTLKEVVILASIVEKETGQAEERPIIASIFLNRLKKGMRLESDPTVIYGIKDFNGNITRKDLINPTPYNTYTIRGLPPGPIANPGKEAIKAVLYPASSDYLYFVSKEDGSHYFSKTLSDHNQAVVIYQKKGRLGTEKFLDRQSSIQYTRDTM